MWPTTLQPYGDLFSSYNPIFRIVWRQWFLELIANFGLQFENSSCSEPRSCQKYGRNLSRCWNKTQQCKPLWIVHPMFQSRLDLNLQHCSRIQCNSCIYSFELFKICMYFFGYHPSVEYIANSLGTGKFKTFDKSLGCQMVRSCRCRFGFENELCWY